MTEIEKRIIDLLHQQNVKGISKYGKPLEQTDLQTVEVIEHAQQELIDLLQYLERIKQLLLNPELVRNCDSCL